MLKKNAFETHILNKIGWCSSKGAVKNWDYTSVYQRLVSLLHLSKDQLPNAVKLVFLQQLWLTQVEQKCLFLKEEPQVGQHFVFFLKETTRSKWNVRHFCLTFHKLTKRPIILVLEATFEILAPWGIVTKAVFVLDLLKIIAKRFTTEAFKRKVSLGSFLLEAIPILENLKESRLSGCQTFSR